MNERLDPPLSPDELRRRAEARLQQLKAAEDPARAAVDTARLLHELQVHRIELEMQNEALTQARDDMEGLLAGYIELYDDAPVGYLTIDPLGTIMQMNLTGARMLGLDRSKVGQPRLGLFVSADEREALSKLLDRVFDTGVAEACETTVTGLGQTPVLVRIEAARSAGGDRCRLVLVELAARPGSAPPVR